LITVRGYAHRDTLALNESGILALATPPTAHTTDSSKAGEPPGAYVQDEPVLTGRQIVSGMFAFTLASLARIAIPGPNMVFIVTRTTPQGCEQGCARPGVEAGT
jgi:hypothetical protein